MVALASKYTGKIICGNGATLFHWLNGACAVCSGWPFRTDRVGAMADIRIIEKIE